MRMNKVTLFPQFHNKSILWLSDNLPIKEWQPSRDTDSSECVQERLIELSFTHYVYRMKDTLPAYPSMSLTNFSMKLIFVLEHRNAAPSSIVSRYGSSGSLILRSSQNLTKWPQVFPLGKTCFLTWSWICQKCMFCIDPRQPNSHVTLQGDS